MGRGLSRNIGRRSQTTGQLVPAAWRTDRAIGRIAELYLDAATLQLIGHRAGVGVGLTIGTRIAAELVIHHLVAIVRNRHRNWLNAKRLNLLGNDSAGIGNLLLLYFKRMVDILPGCRRSVISIQLRIFPAPDCTNVHVKGVCDVLMR